MHEDLFQKAETERRLANIVTQGEVIEVSADDKFAKVKIGDDQENNITDWLPVFQLRLGQIKFRFPPSVGEIVAVYSPSGEIGAAHIGPSMVTPDNALPFSTGKVGIEFAQGNHIVFDSNSNELALEAAAAIVIKADGSSVSLQNGKVTIGADSIDLGDSGGLGVARIGDSVAGGKIITGSNRIKAV